MESQARLSKSIKPIRSAFISGATSGIGRAFADFLHAAGWNLFICARRTERLQQIATSFNRARSNSCQIFPADLSQPASTKELAGLNAVEELLSERHIDLFISNAGFGSFGPLEKQGRDSEQSMIYLNTIACMRLCHAVIPQMKSRKSGEIVIISSLAGFNPFPYFSTYAGTKAFNLNFALSLRAELKRFGINVLAVCPGPVATEFGKIAGYSSGAPWFPAASAKQVASSALQALKKGKAFVIPGVAAKAAFWGGRFLPVGMKGRMVERLLR